MNVEIEMALYVCKACGIPFALPRNFAGNPWHGHILCPNGHCLLDGRDVVQKLRDDAQFAEAQCREANEDVLSLERTVSALRGVITRLRNGH